MTDIVLFEDDAQQVEVRLEGETVWFSLQQLADLVGCDKSVISRHLKNIFESGELQRDSVVAKNATTAVDGKVVMVRLVMHLLARDAEPDRTCSTESFWRTRSKCIGIR